MFLLFRMLFRFLLNDIYPQGLGSYGLPSIPLKIRTGMYSKGRNLKSHRYRLLPHAGLSTYRRRFIKISYETHTSFEPPYIYLFASILVFSVTSIGTSVYVIFVTTATHQSG